jgi:hypothetical protein
MPQPGAQRRPRPCQPPPFGPAIDQAGLGMGPPWWPPSCTVHVRQGYRRGPATPRSFCPSQAAAISYHMTHPSPLLHEAGHEAHQLLPVGKVLPFRRRRLCTDPRRCAVDVTGTFSCQMRTTKTCSLREASPYRRIIRYEYPGRRHGSQQRVDQQGSTLAIHPMVDTLPQCVPYNRHTSRSRWNTLHGDSTYQPAQGPGGA